MKYMQIPDIIALFVAKVLGKSVPSGGMLIFLGKNLMLHESKYHSAYLVDFKSNFDL